jgi:hypothetical protein
MKRGHFLERDFNPLAKLPLLTSDPIRFCFIQYVRVADKKLGNMASRKLTQTWDTHEK